MLQNFPLSAFNNTANHTAQLGSAKDSSLQSVHSHLGNAHLERNISEKNISAKNMLTRNIAPTRSVAYDFNAPHNFQYPSSVELPRLTQFSLLQKKSHYFFDRASVKRLGALLSKPYKHFIETNEVAQISEVLSFIRTEYPHASLSLTAHSAFTQPVADLFSSCLAERHRLTLSLQEDIKTCLQEAIMNAVIHGSLGIASPDSVQKNFSVNSFQDYMEKVSEKINDNTLGLKRISVYSWSTENHMTICVADQGRGFDINQPAATDPQSPYGRGLELIRGLAQSIWQEDSQCLYMQFSKYS